MDSILNNLKQEFKQGTILNKLIFINVGLFLLFSILGVFSFMFQFNITPIINKFYLASNAETLIKQPWSFISYMFLHNSLLHLIFNMIWLHFVGKLFLEHLNPKQLLSTYILGGISGGLIFIISYNYIPIFQPFSTNASAVGASASVFAIMMAIATYRPNYNIQLPFLGYIRLKHIALFMIILDILSIPKSNAGGHIAHLGGALFGFIYVRKLKQGTDYSVYFSVLLENISNTFKRKSGLRKKYKRTRSDHEFNSERVARQKEIDKVLEKIANSGYESLDKKEKETLFKASKR